MLRLHYFRNNMKFLCGDGNYGGNQLPLIEIPLNFATKIINEWLFTKYKLVFRPKLWRKTHSHLDYQKKDLPEKEITAYIEYRYSDELTQELAMKWSMLRNLQINIEIRPILSSKKGGLHRLAIILKSWKKLSRFFRWKEKLLAAQAATSIHRKDYMVILFRNVLLILYFWFLTSLYTIVTNMKPVEIGIK